MSILDIIIFLVIVYNTLKGFQTGFTTILCDVIALFGSIFIGLHYYAQVATLLETTANLSPKYSDIVAFGLIWLFIFMIMSLINVIVKQFVSALSLGVINRLMGLGLSTLKALILLMPLLIPIAKYDPALVENSKLAKPILPVVLKIKQEFVDPHLGDVESLFQAANSLVPTPPSPSTSTEIELEN